MYTHVEKSKQGKERVKANVVFQKQNSNTSTLQLVDNRPGAIIQREMHGKKNNSPQAQKAIQLQATMNKHFIQEQQVFQKKENNTGLPDKLKSGIENLSGHSMDDVKVHYNSSKPAQLNAHAYAQGTNIHVASGQEKHLPHEAWHVVQQKQGRVKPTIQMKGGAHINDDAGLEKEADVMGAKVLQGNLSVENTVTSASSLLSDTHPIQKKILDQNKSYYTPRFDGKVLQRQIEYDASKSAYETNSTRPGWRKVAEEALLEEFNIRHGLTIDKLNYAQKKLDRCHIVAFEDIQTNMASFLNKSKSASDFESFIYTITAHLQSSGEERIGIITNWRYLQDIVKTGSTDSIVTSANSLLSRLNSISENLRAGNKYLNAYIQQNLDLLFQKTNSGKYQLTDHSRTVLSKGGSNVSDVLRTPGKSRLVTSEGPIAFGDMTPRSEAATKSRAFTTREAKSSNVRRALYGKDSDKPQVKGYRKATTTAVHPQILKLQPLVDLNKVNLLTLKKRESDLRGGLDKLVTISKEANDYNEFLKLRTSLNQKIGGVGNELGGINNNLTALIPKYHQNKKSLDGLLGQRNAIQIQMHRTDNVNAYEQHEQNAFHQGNMLQSGHTTDPTSYQQSYAEMNRLASTHQDVSSFLVQRQQLNTLDFQIHHLQQENSQIENLYQYSKSLETDLNNLNQQLMNVNAAIASLESSSSDVSLFNNLLGQFHSTLTMITTTEQEIHRLQYELSQIK